jgi:hypothetical protein
LPTQAVKESAAGVFFLPAVTFMPPFIITPTADALARPEF